jgi:hypothetical protein
MFGALDSFDQPFNQAPSLHLSLALIVAARFWTHLYGFERRILEGWFVLVGASALTTYQHHFIDIATGLAVGALCCAFLPDGPLGKASQSRQTKQGTAACSIVSIRCASQHPCSFIWSVHSLRSHERLYKQLGRDVDSKWRGGKGGITTDNAA